MSYSLATLWYERQRFIPGVLAVCFSAMLIALQFGLLLGLFSICSIPIDYARAHIWVGHPKVPSVDLGRPIPESWQAYMEAMPEVKRTEVYIQNFCYWVKPIGGTELVSLIGARLAPDSLGATKALTPEHRSKLGELGTVVVDRGEFDRLGISKIGDTAEILERQVRVVDVIEGYKSLAGPYIFCSVDTAKWILRPPEGYSTFLLASCYDEKDAPKVVARLQKMRIDPGADADKDKEKVSAFTRDEFSLHSQMHWLLKTKAGFALGLSAVLGLMVGAAVTSQTLYAATAASMREYAVLRALGIPRYRMSLAVLAQAFWVGIAGIALALPLIYGLKHLAGRIDTKVLLPWQLIALAIAVTMTMAMASGLLALRSLRTMEPVALLR